MSTNEMLIYVNGSLVPRSQATVSVYDAGFISGDGVFEGLRLYKGKVFKLSEHINRLLESAHALDIASKYSADDIRTAVRRVIEANGLTDGVHLRIHLTRGPTRIAQMDPAYSLSSPTLVIYAEVKEPIYAKKGIRLMTSHIRRIPPDCLDQKIHTFNKINSVLAKLEANRLGLDDAIMLDTKGFVAETTTANIFFVKKNTVSTPYPTSCLNGITRQTVLAEAEALGYQAIERDHSIYDVYNSDEIFLTGTVGEITPVIEVDGRKIGSGDVGETTLKISAKYMKLVQEQGEIP